jgi:hypothetical protein
MAGGTAIRPSANPNRIPSPNTPAGDMVRDKFIRDLLDICGDVRAYWLPKWTDGTTTIGVSRQARVFTYDATIAARISALGSAAQVDFDGGDDEADTPDTANLSFGDGVVDKPFSVLWLGTPDTDTSVQTLVSKMNSATVDEWELFIEVTTGHIAFDLVDASASAFIGRQDETAIGTSAVFIAATYDGSGAIGGINLYKDAALVDDANSAATTGTYVAMEDTASLLRLGNRFATNEGFYNGKMALAAVVGKALDIEEIWAIKAAINGFFDLSL